MAFSLKNIIFKNFFGKYEKEIDTFKDPNNKGFKERFNELVGEEFDENTLTKIVDIFNDTIIPASVESKFLPYLENDRGIEDISSSDETKRRRIIRFYKAIIQAKGTVKSYRLLLYYNGFTLNSITETFKNGSLDDDDRVFDDELSTFDSKCQCTIYDINLSGQNPVTEEIFNKIKSIASFLEPVTAKLGDVIYNGDLVTQFYPFTVVTTKVGLFELTWASTEVTLLIDWGDGTEEVLPTSSDLTHNYTDIGAKEIQVKFSADGGESVISAAGMSIFGNVNMNKIQGALTVDLSNNSIDSILPGPHLNLDQPTSVDLSGNQMDNTSIQSMIDYLEANSLNQTTQRTINTSNNAEAPAALTISKAADLLANKNILVILSSTGNKFELEDSGGFIKKEDDNFILIEDS